MGVPAANSLGDRGVCLSRGTVAQYLLPPRDFTLDLKAHYAVFDAPGLYLIKFND
jgi:hypothetical protein